jgi:hypoxanthine phosphoribosyltransferase
MKQLFTEDQIQKRVFSLAEAIAKENSSKRLLVLFVLKGAFIFCADLVRALGKRNVDVTLDYVAAKSYQGKVSAGEVKLSMDVDIEGKDVLLVEDIIDTGKTIKVLKDELAKKHPLSLRTVCFLDKPSRREVEIDADYVGFQIEDKFVVGYGLDYNEKYRCLPFIAVID